MTPDTPHHDMTRVVFLHIPKTAGQSIHSELAQFYPVERVSPIRVHTQVKAGETQYPAGYGLYSGHLDWTELGAVPTPRFVFTVLRDPLERIASFYSYLCAQAANLTPEDLAKPQHTGMRVISSRSAEDYFFGGDEKWQRFIRDHYDNVQTTYLATLLMRGWHRIKDLPTDELLDRAAQNARVLDAIYSTKTLDRLETDLEQIFAKRPNITTKRVNVGPKTSGKRWPELADRLGPNAAARLTAYAETDLRLFDRLGLDP